MDALLMGGATSVAAKVEAKRNEAFEWIKDAVTWPREQSARLQSF